MNNIENKNDQVPSIDELQKEIRVLKRKLALTESAIARSRQIKTAQDRVETILNESLSKELQYFKLVLENTTNILLLFDFDGRFAYASDTFLKEAGIANFGLINGNHFGDVLEPRVSEKNMARFKAAVDRANMLKRTVSLEERIDFNLRGLPRTFSIHVTPMTDEEGKITGTMALFNNITEIKNAMEEAKRANLAKSEFLANMSHEIRTPMNAIIGMTAIGKSSADAERKDYCFSRIEGASNHLLGVINDILDMSKIEANKLELSLIEFDFEEMIRGIVNVVSFRVDEKKQKFTVHIDNAIPKTLIGDDQRLAQVITNLVGNAVKFTPDGGSIKLNTRFSGDENGECTIQVEVTDTGIGINPEQQTRLFASFQQAESSTTRKFGGSGLGLVISKSIVEMMGGRIWVKSELEKGSTFAFTVRLKRGAEKTARQYANVNWSDIRVLVVDDDPEVLSLFSETMQKSGAHCDTAVNGEDALAIVENNGAYDFYFVDWMMPGMDGLQLAEALKENVSNSISSVIMISSADWYMIEEKAKEAGVDKFLSKPIFASDIINIITDALGVGQRRTEAEHEDISVNFAGNRVLLVEDMEINREIVLALLEPTLLEIDCAENGVEGVRMFNEAPDKYDMIFMDVQMPEMDGYEATRHIRSLEARRAKEIPVVAMTANVFREDVERCLEAGMNDHVGKPLDFDKVLVLLKKYLRSD